MEHRFLAGRDWQSTYAKRQCPAVARDSDGRGCRCTELGRRFVRRLKIRGAYFRPPELANRY
jgi:hypothetical protein